jgi:hypothetical protein
MSAYSPIDLHTVCLVVGKEYAENKNTLVSLESKPPIVDSK